MLGFLIFIHILVCILLAAVILMQAGRGGGLTEQFASAESMFGAKTNVFMVKATAIFASLFIITSLTLAFLSLKRDRSLMTQVAQKAQAVKENPQEADQAVPQGVVPEQALSAAEPARANQPIAEDNKESDPAAQAIPQPNPTVDTTNSAATQPNSAETSAGDSQNVQPTTERPAAAQ